MDDDSLKRYRNDQAEFFAELDTAGSPEAMIQKMADMLLAGPLGAVPSADQGHKDMPKLVAALRARDQQLGIAVSVEKRRSHSSGSNGLRDSIDSLAACTASSRATPSRSSAPGSASAPSARPPADCRRTAPHASIPPRCFRTAD
jgi:hypothetical protein